MLVDLMCGDLLAREILNGRPFILTCYLQYINGRPLCAPLFCAAFS